MNIVIDNFKRWQQNCWQIHAKELILPKVAGPKPETLVKCDPFTGEFQQSRLIFRNTYWLI